MRENQYFFVNGHNSSANGHNSSAKGYRSGANIYISFGQAFMLLDFKCVFYINICVF